MLFRYDDAIAERLIRQVVSSQQMGILRRQGLVTGRDFLLHRPLRYTLRLRTLPLDRQAKQVYTLVGQLMGIRQHPVKDRLVVYNATLQLERITVPVRWFNQQYASKPRQGRPWVVLTGTFETDAYGEAFQVTDFEWYADLALTGHGRVFPHYSPIRGVPNRLIWGIIRLFQRSLPITDLMPAAMVESQGVLTIQNALSYLHFPCDVSQVTAAMARLGFDELVCYLLPRRQQHAAVRAQVSMYRLTPPDSGSLTRAYIQALPYALTGAQSRVWSRIQADIARGHPVFRLIQGDVGSGKTDIAILAALAAVECGYKAAFLVPTELLADQHYLTLSRRCKTVSIGLLKGQQSKAERREVMAALAGDAPMIVVGTHALIQEGVTITQLAMVIIDEQHRFGVFQRQQLLEKSDAVPHCVFMSATPIPRTLMLTHYGDLDHDTIDALPPGRQPPKTHVVAMTQVMDVYAFIAREVAAGRQAYVVYPLIESSDHLENVQPAVDGFHELATRFDTVSVGLLHGKMPLADKQAVMERFAANAMAILVATTVIEVGIDVPNATVMVIMNAERFGLSQLHQLRGRVGRGAHQSYCFLVSSPRTDDANQRLAAMAATTNGFELAQRDLAIRGPGNCLGTQQSGELVFRFADSTAVDQLERITAICDHMLSQPTVYAPVIDGVRSGQPISAALLN
jgi:ATP-dependent DNA helicase RecG